MSVVGNGVDLAGWVAAERRPQARLRLVSATRFAPRKRVFSLLLVMARLRRELGTECPTLTIAGSGELLLGRGSVVGPVLTTDPGMGVVRHLDAGYPEAEDAAREHGLSTPGFDATG